MREKTKNKTNPKQKKIKQPRWVDMWEIMSAFRVISY